VREREREREREYTYIYISKYKYILRYSRWHANYQRKPADEHTRKRGRGKNERELN
jgi:hypothetical protein